jgi:hypothetical protein
MTETELARALTCNFADPPHRCRGGGIESAPRERVRAKETGGERPPFEVRFPRSASETMLLMIDLASADDVDRHIGKAGKAQCPRCCRRDVDNAAADERPTIIDAHHDRAAGTFVGDPHQRSKRQRLMGRCQPARRCPLAIGGAPAGVNRGNSTLCGSRYRHCDNSGNESRSKQTLREASNSHDHPIQLLMGGLNRSQSANWALKQVKCVHCASHTRSDNFGLKRETNVVS